MALVLVSSGGPYDIGDCQGKITCPGVWIDNEHDPEYAIVVGQLIDPAPMSIAPGERAVRLRRTIIRNANIRGF